MHAIEQTKRARPKWWGRTRTPGIALAALALVAAACGGHTGGTSGSASSSPSRASAFGSYAGTGGGSSLTITFTASASGITGLSGETLLVCTQTSGNSVQYGVSSTIPLDGSKSFTSDTTTQLSSGGNAELKVSGSLDGSGHASGTLSYNLANACDTGTIKWSASIGGSTTPTAAPSSSACSPQPCGTSGGVTLAVTGIKHIPASPVSTAPCDPSAQICAGPSPTPDLVEVMFTVTNNGTTALDVSGSLDLYGLQPGNGATVNDNDVSSTGTLPDGTACRGDDASLQPGAHSPTLHTCFLMTDAQVAGPFKFIWSIDTGGPPAGGTIDLSGMTIQ